jgi:hypothetical protein
MDSPFYIRKLANASSAKSKLSPVAKNVPIVGDATSRAVESYRKRHGGIWVGGVVEIFADRISFRANALNKALHSGSTGKHIPMKEVQSVQWKFGWVTGIVVVAHRRGEFRFRCFGARSVARRLSAHLAAL